VFGFAAENPTPVQKSFDVLFIVASLIIGEAHQFTSIVRYFSVRPRKNPRRLDRVPFWFVYSSMLLVAALGVITNNFSKSPDGIWMFLVSGFALIFQLGQVFFPVVLVQHVIAQANAIGMIYCGKQGYSLSRRESLTLTVAAWTLVLAGAIKLAAPFGTLDVLTLFANLVNLPATQPLPANSIQALQFLGTNIALVPGCLFAKGVVMRGIRTGEWPPVPAPLIWINLAALILMPQSVTLYAWIFTPLLFHATQHWSIAWIARQQEVREQGRTHANRIELLKEFLMMAAPVQALTLAILFLPALLSNENAAGTGATLGVAFSMFIFYLHYFSDRIVWRKDKETNNGY
jgi:hypothetical protein